MPNGWARGELDLLPTPEQTPLQQKRPPPGLRLGGDTGWDQSQTFLGSAGGTPCPQNVIYLSSKLLQGSGGGRREDSSDPGQPMERQHYLALAGHHLHHHRGGEGQGGRAGMALRNSAGDYTYPATPQESPDRRRAISAPNTQLEFGEHLRWGPDGYNFNSNNGAPAPSPGLCHYAPAASRPHPSSLSRPTLHGAPRGLADVPDFSRLLVKSTGERTTSSQ